MRALGEHGRLPGAFSFRRQHQLAGLVQVESAAGKLLNRDHLQAPGSLATPKAVCVTHCACSLRLILRCSCASRKAIAHLALTGTRRPSNAPAASPASTCCTISNGQVENASPPVAIELPGDLRFWNKTGLGNDSLARQNHRIASGLGFFWLANMSSSPFRPALMPFVSSPSIRRKQ